MSISWYIYKASPQAGPITTWDVDRSERVALLATVQERLSSVFPTLRWSTYSFQVGVARKASQPPSKPSSIPLAAMKSL
jgi:hypothetical protein